MGMIWIDGEPMMDIMNPGERYPITYAEVEAFTKYEKDKETYNNVTSALDEQEEKYFDANRDKILDLIQTFEPDKFPAGDDWDDNDIIDLVHDYIHEHLQDDFTDFIFSQDNCIEEGGNYNGKENK